MSDYQGVPIRPIVQATYQVVLYMTQVEPINVLLGKANLSQARLVKLGKANLGQGLVAKLGQANLTQEGDGRLGQAHLSQARLAG